MNWLKSKKIIVTHSGRFHADDVFAIALLRMVPEWKTARLIRTRDEEIIKKADLVVDVGMVYNSDLNRFDHHQTGGALNYENGIPYSGFGLVWKKYGAQVCGSKEVAQMITEKLVQPIDAVDNGLFSTFNIESHLVDYTLDDMVDAFNPSWREEDFDRDASFMEAVKIANRILVREIKRNNDQLLAANFVEKTYQETSDKRIIVLSKYVPFQDVLRKYPEPMFVIYPYTLPGVWSAKAITLQKGGTVNRKNFPQAWAGKRNQELASICGISEATFCHNACHLASASSKEGAIKMAELALKDN